MLLFPFSLLFSLFSPGSVVYCPFLQRLHAFDAMLFENFPGGHFWQSIYERDVRWGARSKTITYWSHVVMVIKAGMAFHAAFVEVTHVRTYT